jgi:hypothetical protein
VSPQRATTVDVTTNDESVESSVDAAEIGSEDSVTATVDDSRPPNDDEQDALEPPDDDRSARSAARGRWTTVAVFGLLPALLAALTLTAGFFKWQVGTADDADLARVSSLQAATEGTVALLTYQAKTVDRDSARPSHRSVSRLLHVADPRCRDPRVETAEHLDGRDRPCGSIGIGQRHPRGCLAVRRSDDDGRRCRSYCDRFVGQGNARQGRNPLAHLRVRARVAQRVRDSFR